MPNYIKNKKKYTLQFALQEYKSNIFTHKPLFINQLQQKKYTINIINFKNTHAFYFINYLRIRPPIQVPRLFHGIFFGSVPLFGRIFSL